MNSLEALIAPHSIAIVGASDDADRIGGRPLAALLRFKYAGAIYPINPNRSTVQGLPAFKSVADLPGPVDCAIVALPASGVLEAAQACADRGVRSLVVFSAGFAEIGPEGARQQQVLTDLSRRTGMRIIGPNCMGLFNSAANAYMTFTQVLNDIRPVERGLALISQSGGYGSGVLKLAATRNLQFGTWITTGNECDVEVGSLLEALAPRPDVAGIVMYVEGVRDGAAFVRGLSSARAHGKPVLVMKVGRTSVGAQAVASHTASIAGEDWVYDAVLRQWGAHRVRSTEELIDLALFINSGRAATGRRLGVVTTSGGIGAQIADLASDHGLLMPGMPESVQARIRALVPNAGVGNPVDVTGQIINDPSVLASCLSMMFESGEFDSIYIYLGLIAGSQTLGRALLDSLREARQRHPEPLVMISVIGSESVVRAYEDAGFLVTEDPSRAILALASLTKLRSRATTPAPPRAWSPLPAALPHGRRFNEVEAKQVFAEFGIRSPCEHLVATDMPLPMVEYPVALKVVSGEIPHKTEIGGVALNLTGPAELQNALDQMQRSIAEHAAGSRVDGFLVTPMIKGGVECLLGLHCDPVFGPIVLFGLGGVAVEIFRDVTCRLAPVSALEAHEMIREIRSYPLLTGYRGKPAADVNALAEAIASFSRLALANADRIKAAEINPLVVLPIGQGVLALDAVLETLPDPMQR